MIYIAHENEQILKVAIEPFAGCTAVLFAHQADIITAPGNYLFRDDGIVLLPELWAHTDRPVRMKLSYDDALTMSETMPELLLQLKAAGMPVVKDPVNRVTYTYFLTITTEERSLLESLGGHFENLEPQL